MYFQTPRRFKDILMFGTLPYSSLERTVAPLGLCLCVEDYLYCTPESVLMSLCMSVGLIDLIIQVSEVFSYSWCNISVDFL